MYILNIASAIKKMTVNELRDFMFENYYKQIRFVKERNHYSMECLKRKGLLMLATKLIENKVDPCNDKKHYQSFLRKKNKKNLVKQSKIITQQPKLLKTQRLLI